MTRSADLSSLCPTIAAADPKRCRQLLAILGEGLEVRDPEAAVARALAGRLDEAADVTVLAVGKAAPAMARGAAGVLGDSLRRCVVVSDHTEAVPPGAELLVTSHPLPDRSSVVAGRRLLEMAGRAADHVVFLISGGGSALAEVPAEPLTLADLRQVYAILLRAGMPIEEANIVRAYLSAIKGGRLAAAAAAPTTTVVLSDVGPRLEAVASGPSLPAPAPPETALTVLGRRGLTDRLPPGAIAILESAGPPPRLPPGEVISAGDGAAAARATAAAGRRAGLPISVVSVELDGEAAEAARWALKAVAPGEVGILAGETTVTVRGEGKGGRNQEAALSAALVLEKTPGVFVALGTDGIDGPTDAAGAYVDRATAARIRAGGVDPQEALHDNDSHRALGTARALIRTGPTGTNVADIWLVDRR